MFAARRVSTLVVRRSTGATVVPNVARNTAQRRSAQTVPRMGTEEEMKAEALEQIKARVAAQKEIELRTHISHDKEMAEMWRWIQISFAVAFPLCILSSLKDVFFGEHHHRQEDPLPDYMKIRSKEFPWECEDCALFDLGCWKKCRAEKAMEGQ